ncbi:GTPase domain-containing protein [Brassicibacter mesophilus]|uniref:GTPase domain-containing protein n=1 Tax=Brassicibacter mesophilus TaxID=745119 RepID=UPI003D1AD190
MKEALIIGKTNVGKSLFLVNFTEFLGYKKIYLNIEGLDGKVLKKEMSIDIAIKYLSSNQKFKTKCLQFTELKIPVSKGYKEIRIIDSSGLTDGIHPDLNIRCSIVQTLEKLENTGMIIHIVDLTEYIDENINLISEIDKQIIRFGSNKNNYILLANKIDLDKDGKGLRYLQSCFNNIRIIPISALYRDGFNEVKSYVIKSL